MMDNREIEPESTSSTMVEKARIMEKIRNNLKFMSINDKKSLCGYIESLIGSNILDKLLKGREFKIIERILAFLDFESLSNIMMLNCAWYNFTTTTEIWRNKLLHFISTDKHYIEHLKNKNELLDEEAISKLTIKQCIRLLEDLMKKCYLNRKHKFKTIFHKKASITNYLNEFTLIGEVYFKDNLMYFATCSDQLVEYNRSNASASSVYQLEEPLTAISVNFPYVVAALRGNYIYVFEIPSCDYITNICFNGKHEISFIKSFNDYYIFYFESGILNIWQLKNLKLEKTREFKKIYCTEQCMALDNKYLAVSYKSDKIEMINFVNNNSKYFITARDIVLCIHFSHPILMCGCQDGTICIFNSQELINLFTIDLDFDRINFLQFDQNYIAIICGGWKQEVMILVNPVDYKDISIKENDSTVLQIKTDARIGDIYRIYIQNNQAWLISLKGNILKIDIDSVNKHSLSDIFVV